MPSQPQVSANQTCPGDRLRQRPSPFCEDYGSTSWTRCQTALNAPPLAVASITSTTDALATLFLHCRNHQTPAQVLPFFSLKWTSFFTADLHPRWRNRCRRPSPMPPSSSSLSSSPSTSHVGAITIAGILATIIADRRHHCRHCRIPCRSHCQGHRPPHHLITRNRPTAAKRPWESIHESCQLAWVCRPTDQTRSVALKFILNFI